MRRSRARAPSTDYGTVVLHWLVVCLIVVATGTGLRIAVQAPDREWINSLDAILPQDTVWTAHIPAGVLLAALMVAYAVYISRTGLWPRIRLDRVRLKGLFGNARARWTAANTTLYWVFYLALLSQAATGGLIYFGFANNFLFACHWYGMWVILGYVVLHLLSQAMLGGFSQLTRILRPGPLGPRMKPLDPVELLLMLADKPSRSAAVENAEPCSDATSSAGAPGPEQTAPSVGDVAIRLPRPSSAIEYDLESNRHNGGSVTLQANPLLVAFACAFVGIGFIFALDRTTGDTLHIRHIAETERPTIDGDTSDPIWRATRPLLVAGARGGNFDDAGETRIEVRAVHDGTTAYFLFSWDDPTRSLKQLPLKKFVDGWRLLHDGFEAGDEHSYSEDKFAVLLTTMDAELAGDRTFHAGMKPITGKPGPLSGRGLHYTVVDGALVDVWQWKATSGGSSGWMDDDYIGAPADPTEAQAARLAPYHGGFAADPGQVNHSNNFEIRSLQDFERPIKPLRLPLNLDKTLKAMGRVDLDPNHGDPESARWYMSSSESVPYSAETDARIPIGTVIPGVIVSGDYSGDAADIRCAARWAAGRWALEIARKIDTESQFDKPIRTGTLMRLAVFDHAQSRHTRHVRPVRLEVE
jgi:Ethylbenzene dehydrogenase/Prokaryotic cytochrome b561